MDPTLITQLGFIGVLIPLAGPVISQLIDNIDYTFNPSGIIKFILCYAMSLLVMILLVLTTSTVLDITVVPKILFAGILLANVAGASHAHNKKIASKPRGEIS